MILETTEKWDIQREKYKTTGRIGQNRVGQARKNQFGRDGVDKDRGSADD